MKKVTINNIRTGTISSLESEDPTGFLEQAAIEKWFGEPEDYTINIEDIPEAEYLYNKKYNEINTKVGAKIVNSFTSSVLESNYKYDNAITDQMELYRVKMENIDFNLKVIDPLGGKKKRLLHTKEQILLLYKQLFDFIMECKLAGNAKKFWLTDNYNIMPIEDLRNYNTDI